MIRLGDKDRLIKPGRALFSVVGLRRAFDPEPLHITKAQVEQAVKLEPRIHEAIAEFLAGKRESIELPKIDFAQVADLLFHELDPATTETKLAQFKGDEGGDDLAATATAARNYLQTKLPRRMRRAQPFTDPKPAQPSTAEIITFRRHLAAVEDPAWAIRQLLAATLGREHIEALKAVWPDALESARRAAMVAIADQKKAPGYVMPRRIARQLGVLLEEPGLPDGFVDLLQQTFANEQKEQSQRPAPTPTPDGSHLETIVQQNSAQR